MTQLSLAALRAANTARLPQFRNAQGERAHSQSDGSDWSPADWMVATTGELGELANVMKKIRRGDMSTADALPKLRQEIADVAIYLDLLAMQLGIDLDTAVADTFNAKSEQVGATIKLYPHGDYFVAVEAPRAAPTPLRERVSCRCSNHGDCREECRQEDRA